MADTPVRDESLSGPSVAVAGGTRPLYQRSTLPEKRLRAAARLPLTFSGFDADRAVDRRRVEEHAVLDHQAHVAHVADAHRRVALDQHQVGELAGRDRAQV